MPLASHPGRLTGQQTTTMRGAHYATPKDRTQASSLGSNFVSATASRATARSGVPGANAVRAYKWSRAWRLPMNEKAHQVLCLKRVPERFAAIALEPLGEYSLFDKFRRAVMKTWSAIVQHEPALQDTPSTSWVALGMHWAFPHNSLLCIEASMHVLANMMPIRPDAEIPQNVINTVVALIETKRASLTAKWRRMRIDPSEIISPLIKNLGVPMLGETLWPSVFGACCVGGDDSAISIAPSSVLEPSSSLLLYVAALLLIRAPLVEKARTRERVFTAHNHLYQQDGGDHVLRSVCHIMSKLVRDLIPQMVLIGPNLPRREMVDFSEDDDYYPPLLNPEDEPERLLRVSVPEFLDAVEKNELLLAKRGIAKQHATSNAGEAIAWNRALAVQQPQAQLEIMEKELARRNHQKGFLLRSNQQDRSASASAQPMMASRHSNVQSDLENLQEENLYQRQMDDRFVGDTRYVSPSVRSNAAAAAGGGGGMSVSSATTAASGGHYYQQQHFVPQAVSSLAAAPSTTSVRRNGNSIQTASTLVQTSIPKVMQRSSATKPPSSVDAVLQSQRATHPFNNNSNNNSSNSNTTNHLLYHQNSPSSYSQQQQNQHQQFQHLQTPSSSSNPTGMVNSPPKPMPPSLPFGGATNNQGYYDNQGDDEYMASTNPLPKRGSVQVSSGRGSNQYYNQNGGDRAGSVNFEAAVGSTTMKTPYFATKTPSTGLRTVGSGKTTVQTHQNRPTSAHRHHQQPATSARRNYQQQQEQSPSVNLTNNVKKRRPVSSGDNRGRRRFFDATSFLKEDNYYPYSTTTHSTSS